MILLSSLRYYITGQRQLPPTPLALRPYFVSSFLYRGRFVDYENTFDTTEEPDYLVHLESDADVGVLQSKEWFEWDDLSSSLLAGTSLIFRIQSQVSFKDKTAYRTFPSLVISSLGTNSRSSSRSALWTSSRMIHKVILSWLICNATERLRV